MQASLLASTTVALTVGLVALVGSTTSSGGGVTNAGSVAQAKFGKNKIRAEKIDVMMMMM